VLSSLKNIFKVPDLRGKILFTLLMVALYRLGAHLPVPGIDYSAVKQLQEQATQQGAIGFLNLFSGGALSQFAIFALGIMPYITASIIVQILGVVIPKLEEWQNQGAVGQRKITQWTRYLALGIALLQASGLTFIFGRGSGAALLGGGQAPTVVLLPDAGWTRYLLVILTLVAGTALLMWMGELITQRGIGNGMSVLIFTSVISRLPQDGRSILVSSGSLKFAVVLVMGLAIIVAVIFLEQGQRRIPVQYAKRVVGRRMTAGGSTYIPLKVNQAGVIPIIFASSLLYFPTLLASVYHAQWFQDFVNNQLTNQRSFVYMTIYGLLVVFFAYFYTAIAFNPVDTADNLRKYGGFVPGIRPGPPTADYLSFVLTRITLPGSLYLALIALLPSIVFAFWVISSFPFGGTSLLITVGVALETMKQLESQLMMRHYEGFLK
jgi:preprotein translocase subunit SecY